MNSFWYSLIASSYWQGFFTGILFVLLCAAAAIHSRR